MAILLPVAVREHPRLRRDVEEPLDRRRQPRKLPAAAPTRDRHEVAITQATLRCVGHVGKFNQGIGAGYST